MTEGSEDICPICGGVMRITYTFTLEQCMPKSMHHSPIAEGQRLCPGHPDSDGRMLTTNNRRLLLESYLSDGLHTEGEDRKQWALYRVAEVLGFKELLDEVEDKERREALDKRYQLEKHSPKS